VIELTHFQAAARQIRFAIPRAMTPASLKLKYPQRHRDPPTPPDVPFSASGG